MKRRLTEAYETMIMSDDCSRRIEQTLERQLNAQQRGRRTVEIYTPPRRNWWAIAAGLVCLVLVLSAGGTFLLLSAANHTVSKTPETAAIQPTVLETTADTEPLTLTESSRQLLTKMCYYMPDWCGYDSLDDEFWNNFLYSSLTNPYYLFEDGKALTICGETDCVSAYWEDLGDVETRVKISRESVNGYVNLVMGCDLPEDFRPNREGLFYADGYFYVSMSDPGSLGYTFRDWELRVETNDTCGFVYFDCYMEEPENVVGSVTIKIYPAGNRHGFTVISKEMKFIDDADRQEVYAVVSAFAEAYFAADTAKMRDYLVQGFDRRVDGYPENGEDVSIENIRGLSEIKQRQVGDVEVMTVEFLEGSWADSFTYLTMELIKQDNGWKIQSYGLEK